MKYSDLPKWSKLAGEWAAEYHAGLSERPVKANMEPGEFASRIPGSAPESPEPMEEIFGDFKRLVPDAMTHWQHPRFFAYFPANAAPASILAEHLVNSMAVNGMLWQTSPAATELETRMTAWLRDAAGLPAQFEGVIHDTATTANICAVLTMRERALEWKGNQSGLKDQPEMRLYASSENHSSIDKAARIAGIGQSGLTKPALRRDRAIDPEALNAVIKTDIEAGRLPIGIVISVGGTATGACDAVDELTDIAKSHDLYTHVDAAWAGSAMICEEFRCMWRGIEKADSVVLNPHKWLGAQIDCSVQFVADLNVQAKTLGIRPEYLRTPGQEDIVNYNELSIGLGRRFRALKLWFLFRAYGLSGLRKMIRNHVAWIKELEAEFAADDLFEVVTSNPLALFTFRLVPPKGDSNELTAELLQQINDDGRIYLTPAVIDGKQAIRVTAGTFATTRDDVLSVHATAREIALRLLPAIGP